MHFCLFLLFFTFTPNDVCINGKVSGCVQECMSVCVSKRVCVCAFKPMIKCMLYDSILCEQNGHHCE